MPAHSSCFRQEKRVTLDIVFEKLFDLWQFVNCQPELCKSHWSHNVYWAAFPG